MGSVPPGAHGRHSDGPPDGEDGEKGDCQGVLAALSDPDCRRILAAVDGAARAADEIAETCELPLSTTYRKLECLQSADLVAEDTRLDGTSNHPSVYTAAVGDVRLWLDEESRVCVEVTDPDGSQRTAGTLAD